MYLICLKVRLLANSTVDLLTNPLILTEGEQIKVQATTADRLHVILSMLQLNRD